MLDLLELTGSQIKAARALAMHQSTVCRSAALMGEQFRLQPKKGASVCRYGSNESLRLLRLAYRAHRLMGSQLRIATDPLHQALLAGMGSEQAVPPRIRPSQEWAQLLTQALIDGAIVSSWCHPRLLPPQRPPCWPGVMAVRLGGLPLQLVTTATESAEELPLRKVLLPHKTTTPLLHLIRTLRQRVLKAGEAPLAEGELPEEQGDAVGGKTRQAGPAKVSSNTYAASA